MSLNGFHASLSETVVIYTLILAVWGLYNFAQRQEVGEGYWIALVLGEMLILVHGLLGGSLWGQGFRPEQEAHVLYGAVTALGIPAGYVVTRGRDGRGANLVYGIVALIMAWLTWQAYVTA